MDIIKELVIKKELEEIEKDLIKSEKEDDYDLLADCAKRFSAVSKELIKMKQK